MGGRRAWGLLAAGPVLVPVLLCASACGGGDEPPSTSDASSADAATADPESSSSGASPRRSPAEDLGEVSAEGGRIVLAQADSTSQTRRCTPAPSDGLVCASDGRTSYRFRPGAVRTLDVATARASYEEDLQDGAAEGTGSWVVRIELDRAASGALEEVSTAAAQSRRPLLVLLPGSRRLLTAPQVNGPISTGDLQITGSFSRAAAVTVVRQITSTTG